MGQMPIPGTSVRGGLLVGLLACAACSTTVSGGQPDVADAAFVGFPDAQPSPTFDAAPQVEPCVEGDAQVSDPATETCYMLFTSLRTWQAAQADCLSLGATLAVVDTDAEQVIVGGLSANALATAPDLWLGATDALVENSFVWVDGQPMVFQKWRDGEPNDNGANGASENCVVIEGDTAAHEWDDRTCSVVSPYICER